MSESTSVGGTAAAFESLLLLEPCLITMRCLLSCAAGVAFFYGGLAQHKNVVSTIMQAFIPLAIIPIVWAIIG
jgi:ammonia channel protein AmtB